MIINDEDEVIVVWRSEVHYCQVITTSILSVDSVENTNYFNHLIGILVIQDSNSGDRASLEAKEWYDRLEYPEYPIHTQPSLHSTSEHTHKT